MKEHTFTFDEQGTAIIMEALVDGMRTSAERLADDAPDPVKVAMHAESVMRTAEILDYISRTVAYGAGRPGDVVEVREGEAPPRRKG